MALKMELFSYLPPMTEQQIAEQLCHVLGSGYVVGIEFTESPQVADDYLTGYDPRRQCQVLSFVVHRSATQQEY